MDEPRSSGFEEWQAELHGHEVVYRMAGSGPPVVLIHGMINSSRHWRAVAEQLAGSYTVIAPDLIGHGDSATPRGDYSIGAHAAAIRDLLAALGVARGDDRRPLARRRRGDAVLLAVPRPGRAPGADLERRPRAEREPAAAGGGAPGRLPGAGDRGPAAGRRAIAAVADGLERRGSEQGASTSTPSPGPCARSRGRARAAPSCRRCAG